MTKLDEFTAAIRRIIVTKVEIIEFPTTTPWVGHRTGVLVPAEAFETFQRMLALKVHYSKWTYEVKFASICGENVTLYRESEYSSLGDWKYLMNEGARACAHRVIETELHKINERLNAPTNISMTSGGKWKLVLDAPAESMLDDYIQIFDTFSDAVNAATSKRRPMFVGASNYLL